MTTVKKRRWITKNGEVREAWTLAFTDDMGKRRKPQFATKRAAEAARIEIEQQLSNGSFRAEAARRTVKDAGELYISHLEGRLQRGAVTKFYVETEQAYFLNYICPQPGRMRLFSEGMTNVKLKQCSPGKISDFLDRLDEKKISSNTQRNVLATLARILKHAVKRDWMATNTATEICIERRREDQLCQVTPPSKEQFALLVQSAEPILSLQICFAGTVGLRASEQHALVWNKVDLEGGLVEVCCALDRYGNIKTTKTKAGIRKVPLGREMVKRLRQHRATSDFAGDLDPVFPNSEGGYKSHRNFMRRYFKPLTAMVSASELARGREVNQCTWHELRHFAISCWIEAGLQPKTVQTFAGHSTIQVTMDRYGHLFPSQLHHKAMDQIAAEYLTNGAQMAHVT